LELFAASRATMAHHIIDADLAAIQGFSHGDIVLQFIDGIARLQVPLFPSRETGYIVTVKLYPNQRPYIEWSYDRSDMYALYTATGSTDVFYDGSYALDSHHSYVLTISDGIPCRPDFVSHDAANRAWCCVEAKSFCLSDPSLDNKVSTYIQVTDHLIVECSQNGRGKVFLWRRQ